MKKLLLALVAAVVFSPAQAGDLQYEPIRAQIGYQTAGCMSDWIVGSLNRGERNRENLVAGAVRMCGGTALNFGWTVKQLVELGFVVLDSTPGVARK